MIAWTTSWRDFQYYSWWWLFPFCFFLSAPCLFLRETWCGIASLPVSVSPTDLDSIRPHSKIKYLRNMGKYVENLWGQQQHRWKVNFRHSHQRCPLLAFQTTLGYVPPSPLFDPLPDPTLACNLLSLLPFHCSSKLSDFTRLPSQCLPPCHSQQPCLVLSPSHQLVRPPQPWLDRVLG